MRKLFSTLGSPSVHDTPHGARGRFTRFETKIEANGSAMSGEKKFTRFAMQHADRALTPVRREDQPEPVSTIARPSPAAPAPLQQSINAMDHLTSEADIPLSIFRKALPKRFAKIYDNDGDAEIAAFFS
ncbi:MAG: hypothetical protein AAFO97_12980 [Pseudomonadota bacterium]